MRTKIYVIACALIAIFLMFTACNSGNNKSNVSTGKIVGQKEVYSCEMNPEVISNKPGKCPKCGMELTKKMVPDTVKITVTDTIQK